MAQSTQEFTVIQTPSTATDARAREQDVEKFSDPDHRLPLQKCF
ncbi:hypothetical protein NITGR_980033 [Nitrospina gracilis 3/211]|uniref:Uncharacterized protein n=1 Tax=Nitrospina gracilis (strain 3/211) TaxID=1266370 RepID=M1ZEY1_NITG3|nr:hypothetical protein NITGR_980033 [Nitrospina gracilis 3/211]